MVSRDEDRNISVEGRLSSMEAKMDIILESLKPDGGIIHKRIDSVENEVKTLQRGAVGLIVTLFLTVIIGVGSFVWNKVTGEK